MKDQFISNLCDGQTVVSCFAIISPQQGTGKAPHKFIIRDNSGDMGAIIWPSKSTLAWEEIARARFADITGLVAFNAYSKGLEIEVKSFSEVADPGDLADFLPTCPADRKALWGELRSLVESLRNKTLKRLMNDLFLDKDFKQAYRTAPAAQHMHHPYIGGLLEHSLEVAGLCDAVAQALGNLDRDLLIVAALLHDIGKIEEIDYTSPCFGATRTGGLLGHVFLGAQRIFDAFRRIPDCPEGLPDMLCHLLLSHHGKMEWGAPVTPCTYEATVLHMCDNMSAQGFYFRQAACSAVEGELFRKVKGIDGYVFTGKTEWKTESEAMPVAHPTAPRATGPPPLRLVRDEDEIERIVLPLLGRIAAGIPTDSQAEVEGRYPVPQTGSVREGDFLLRVRGDSMVDAHILDGDVVHVRPQVDASSGEIVVARVDGESTVKYLVREKDRTLLRPANSAYRDIVPTEDLQIQGIVIGVIRGFC